MFDFDILSFWESIERVAYKVLESNYDILWYEPTIV